MAIKCNNTSVNLKDAYNLEGTKRLYNILARFGQTTKLVGLIKMFLLNRR
jgi:hypothetical protein